jgi:hypothetical protein
VDGQWFAGVEAVDARGDERLPEGGDGAGVVDARLRS